MTVVFKPVLDAIDLLEARLGKMPTLEQIAIEYGTSRSGILQHLKALRRKGYLTWEPGRTGTLRAAGVVVVGVVE